MDPLNLDQTPFDRLFWYAVLPVSAGFTLYQIAIGAEAIGGAAARWWRRRDRGPRPDPTPVPRPHISPEDREWLDSQW